MRPILVQFFMVLKVLKVGQLKLVQTLMMRAIGWLFKGSILVLSIKKIQLYL